MGRIVYVLRGYLYLSLGWNPASNSVAGGRDLEEEGTVSLSPTVLVPAHFRGHLGLRHSTFSPVLSRLGCHPHPVRDQHVDLEPPLALFFSLSIR